ncbi:MAG: SDR family oxidoreductase [Myxococcota bacterium]
MLRNRKILITGATGEVARAIAESLAPNNEVWAAARFTNPTLRQRLEAQKIRTYAWTLGSDDFTGLPDDFDHVIHAACNIFPVANDYDASIRDNAEGTGLLMTHTRRAKSFLYVSSLATYSEIPDNSIPRKETDAQGCHQRFAPSYGIGKTATEAVVRTLARIYRLPTLIGRLGMNYGIGCSGAPDFYFKDMMEGKPIVVPPRGVSYCALVHNSDVVEWVEPLLAAASVPANIVNWTGDDWVDEREMVEFMARIAQLTPKLVEDPKAGYYGGVADPTKRRAITGPARPWKKSFLEMLRANYPDHAFVDVD